ncbi:MAG: PDC sensor domain-containing protein [Pseudomonadota bacterium]
MWLFYGIFGPFKRGVLTMRGSNKQVLYGILVCIPIILVTELSHGQNTPAQVTVYDRLEKEIRANATINDQFKNFIVDVLLKQTTNPVVVDAVKKQNAEHLTLEKIKAIDAKWIAEEGDIPLAEELMNNACAELGKELAQKHPIIEMFVMDNQGANVGQNAITSDYWQGDEEKWQNSFNGGKGGVDIGKLKIDQSTALPQQQVSLPIIDENGSVIGAVCFGIDINPFR